MSEAQVLKRLREIFAKEEVLDIFISGREIKSAGEYTATFVVRILPQEGNSDYIKAIMRLFIQNQEIRFKRSYTATLSERGLRVEDFISEATITL